MLYVKLNDQQEKKVPSKSKGYTSERVNGVKVNVTFCSNLDFIKYVGSEEKEFIKI